MDRKEAQLGAGCGSHVAGVTILTGFQGLPSAS
jgi:hypothetical protein